MNNAILISFDVEEFDIPEEYGQVLPEAVKFDISLAGLRAVLQVLDELQVRVTFFVTAHFADHHPELIRTMGQHHEIASHGYYHSRFQLVDLQTSKQRLEAISGNVVQGFRMARLQAVDAAAIAAAGYTYNSSINPTYLPGRYNHFFAPRTAYYDRQLLQVPISVTPLLRFPLFWLSFKNLPWAWIKLATQWTLSSDHYLNIYFHPWEFTDISGFHLPWYVKRRCGQPMLYRLRRYLTGLQQRGEFITLSEFQQWFASSGVMR